MFVFLVRWPLLNTSKATKTRPTTTHKQTNKLHIKQKRQQNKSWLCSNRFRCFVCVFGVLLGVVLGCFVLRVLFVCVCCLFACVVVVFGVCACVCSMCVFIAVLVCLMCWLVLVLFCARFRCSLFLCVDRY